MFVQHSKLFFIHYFENDKFCFTKTSVTSKLNVRLSWNFTLNVWRLVISRNHMDLTTVMPFICQTGNLLNGSISKLVWGSFSFEKMNASTLFGGKNEVFWKASNQLSHWKWIFLLIISNSDERVIVCRLTLLQIAALESIFRVLIDWNIVESKYFYQKKGNILSLPIFYAI